MDKVFYAFVFVLLLSSSSSAQQMDKALEDFSIPLQLSMTSLPENLELDIYIIYGGGTDTFERMVIDSITNDPSALRSSANVTVDGKTEAKEIKMNRIFLRDSETSLDELKQGTGIVILVGGVTHNNITKEAYESGLITNETVRFQNQLIVGNGFLDDDSKVLVLAHRIPAEGERLEREAAKHSPLASFIPEEYVPVAATGIGMLLLRFFNVFKSITETFALHFGKKKAVYDPSGTRILGVRVREALEFFAGVVVLALALTYTFAGPTDRFIGLFPLCFGVCLAAGSLHEATHRILSKLFGIKAQYRLWPFGSFIALFTAYLGNCFGIEGFMIEKQGQEISRWKYGVMKLAGPMVSLCIACVFSYLFLNNPSVVYQMIFTSASISMMSSLMPVKGTDGYDVREWSHWVWFIAFSIVSVLFFAINFIQ